MTQRPTLHTTRLTLRPFTDADASSVQHLVSAYEIALNTLQVPHPYPEGGALEWIATHEQKFTERRSVPFAITLREGGEVVGAIDLILKLEHNRGELGYWIGVPHWNRGYGSEAVGAVIRYGFEAWSLNRIEAFHFARNPASGRVMIRNGMVHEGTLRQAMKKWDEYVDLEMYSILRSEWQA